MKPAPFSWKARLRSFRYAGQGIVSFFRSEHNTRIHLAATLAVTIAGLFFRLTPSEWTALLLAMALVWITEMLNTCVEKTMDHLSPAPSEAVKQIKDIAAGAVLIAAIAAATTGAIVFLPRLIKMMTP